MTSLAFFYQNTELSSGATLQLDEDTAKHVVQVLRMSVSDKIMLSNGKGDTAEATITSAEKKKCIVLIGPLMPTAPSPHQLHLAVAMTKNTSRNEWLLEKATESGVSSIIPILSSRTEREKFRYDRWQSILISAMLQSKQHYLPQLNEPEKLVLVLERYKNVAQKIVTHCDPQFERSPISNVLQAQQESIILIGPEGDFSPEEIQLCYQHGFKGASLCSQRLRTETAAMSVCAYFNLINHV